MDNYDSTFDTLTHIKKVKDYMDKSAANLKQRGNVHDNSKLVEPEKSYFDKVTPKLKNLEYGSEEYKKSLREIQPALDHHYANNSHHPEFYKNGVNGMSIYDITEMLNDWKAASERHNTGDIYKSLEANKIRYNISDQLYEILKNTIKENGWEK